MAAGKQGSKELVIQVDDAPGGALQNITQHVRTIGGAKIENVLTPSHAFGDAWEEMVATGFARVPPIPLGGLFDNNGAASPHTVLKVQAGDRDPNGATRTVSLNFGDGQIFSGEARLASYEVLGKNEALTEYAAVLQPTGQWTWA